MQFGVWVPNCRHLATRSTIRRAGVLAEELGFASVWVSDHVIVPNDNVANFGEAIYDPFVTLSVIAGATQRVQLGTTVLIVPYRNAIVTAKMVSSLDDLSDGRVVLGIGAGWLPVESKMLGVPFGERGPMTDEYLRAMTILWTADAPAFDGKYTSFRDLRFFPKPVQQPHPPVWVGGHSRAARRRAVALGASWHPINLPVDDLRAGMAEVEELARAAGRTNPPVLTLRNDIYLQLDSGRTKSPAHAGRAIHGPPDVVAEQLRELAAIGVEHLVLEFLADDLPELDEQMRAFTERVQPLLS